MVYPGSIEISNHKNSAAGRSAKSELIRYSASLRSGLILTVIALAALYVPPAFGGSSYWYERGNWSIGSHQSGGCVARSGRSREKNMSPYMFVELAYAPKKRGAVARLSLSDSHKAKIKLDAQAIDDYPVAKKRLLISKELRLLNITSLLTTKVDKPRRAFGVDMEPSMVEILFALDSCIGPTKN